MSSVRSVKLDGKNKNVTLTRQLYNQMKRLIMTGKLKPGSRLMSTREFADKLKISRSTVIEAYEQLRVDGFLEAYSGSGTFINRHIINGSSVSTERCVELAERNCASLENLVSDFGLRVCLLDETDRNKNENRMDFTPGEPYFLSKYHQHWRRLVTKRQSDSRVDSSSAPVGDDLLCDAICTYLASQKGIACSREQVIVLRNIRQAVDLAARLHIDAGDGIAFGSSVRADRLRAFAIHGAKITPLESDSEGTGTDELCKHGQVAPKLVYMSTDNCSNNSSSISLSSKQSLINWARKKSAFVIEEDNGDLVPEPGSQLPFFKALDPDSVIHVGSFSKMVSSFVEIAFLVVPDALVELYVKAKKLVDYDLPLVQQGALADFINEGHLDAMIRETRSALTRRKSADSDACTETVAKAAAIPATEGVEWAAIESEPWERPSLLVDGGTVVQAETMTEVSAIVEGAEVAKNLAANAIGFLPASTNQSLELLAKTLMSIT